MAFFILIIIVVLILLLRRISKRIDEEESVALKTPGRAGFIRETFPKVVDYFSSLPNATILFERTDMIKIGIDGEREFIVISSNSSFILISYIKWSAVQKEWKFLRNEDENHILYELSKYFMY